MVQPDFKHKEQIKLNDYLALERTRLANERTLFSYIRTALYLTLGGIAFFANARFQKHPMVSSHMFCIECCDIGDRHYQIHINEKRPEKVLHYFHKIIK